jgi:hypothetical protein
VRKVRRLYMLIGIFAAAAGKLHRQNVASPCYAQKSPLITQRAFLCVLAFNLARLLYVGGLEAFRALGDVERYGIAFSKGFESVALDRREVNEDVLATFLLDEAETLCVIEPFNLALCHFPASFFLRYYAGTMRYRLSFRSLMQEKCKAWSNMLLQRSAKTSETGCMCRLS